MFNFKKIDTSLFHGRKVSPDALEMRYYRWLVDLVKLFICWILFVPVFILLGSTHCFSLKARSEQEHKLPNYSRMHNEEDANIE